MQRHAPHPGLELYESALFRTVSTLLIGEDHLLLVDPTWLPAEVDAIYARTQQLAEGRSCYLLFTHSDYDHILGFGKFSDWHTIASRAFVENPDPDELLAQIRKFDDEYYILRDHPVVYPRIDTAIDGDGVPLRLGSEDYLFFQAPGHNPDGLLALNLARGVLIVGDYLSNVEFPYIYHSVAAYRGTLGTLEHILDTHPVKVMVSGHGDAATTPEDMRQRVADAHRYLDELEDSVRREVPFDLDRLFTRYRFPGIMRQFHAGNLDLMQQHVAASVSNPTTHPKQQPR